MRKRFSGQSTESGRLQARAALQAACFLPLAGALAFGQGEGIIAGRVTDQRGDPQSVLVHLIAPGELPVDQRYTDSNGLFAFIAIPDGNYYVEVEVEGFRPWRQAVMLDAHIDPKVHLDVSLELLKKDKEPGPVIPGSQSSYKLDIKKAPRPFDRKARLEFDRGREEQEKGNLSAAIKHYEKAIKIEPQFYPALNNLGILEERQKNHAAAEAAFSRSMEINPDDGEAYINLGHALYEEGKYQAAVERLQQGLKRSPGSALGYFFLGSVYLKLGDLNRAETSLKIATDLDSDHKSPARLQLANVYLKRHDTIAASAQLEKYIQDNPSDPKNASLKKLLAEINSPRTD